MALITIERAREIINEIRERNGGLTAEDRRRTPENDLQELDNVLRRLGSSTRALARGLYTNESRFVYELIQNAEDNSYSRAHNDDHYIKFTLTPEKIIVENNGVGFTEAGVRSISKVGGSIKINRIGYIGEKGIGFKSVFQVAQKVRIQSGPFDFYFEHLPSGTGMGMITPMNEEDEPDFYNDGTRITLTLLHPDDFSKRLRDLHGVPDALILFLPKLQRIEVVIQSENGDSSRTVHEIHSDGGNSTMRLVKTVDDAISEKLFHVERRTFRGLPSDSARVNRDSAEVVLAFPITSDSSPILEPQLTFSFLPIRSFGFRFLIQSDFITAANRQDIRLCRWNNALLHHVSEVFVDAVDKFCSRPVLQYEWLSFLPGPSIAHEFWDELHDMIITLLARKPILLTRGKVRQLPSQLQRLSERHCDKNGEPLFDDLQQEVYLSSDYNPEHAQYLRDLGVTTLSWNSILARITPYLQGQNPRFLCPDQDEDWHTRVANLLIRGLKDSNATDIKSKIKRLPLIPLRDGSLCHNQAEDIYFPSDISGNHVPVDLGLRIVDDNALENKSRKTLYEKLGVQYCQSSFVIRQIVKRYLPPVTVNLSDSVSHLKYLYQTLPDDQALDICVFVMDQSQVPIYRKFVTIGRPLVVDDLYFDTIGDFGTRHLAQELKSNGLPDIHILHDAYLEAVSSGEELPGRPWKEWLEKKALIRTLPRLQSSRTTTISPLFTKIIRNRPQLLVGVLKRYWNSYKKQRTDDIEEAIRNAEVPCNGTNTLHPLKAIYLPTSQLTRICKQAGVSDQFDLFLDLGSSSGVSETGISGWEFLKIFGVGVNPDINFFRDIISALTDNITGEDLKRGLFYIYEQLSEEFHSDDGEIISKMIHDFSAVCIPARTVQTTNLISCVWNGLPCLHVKDCLSQYPEYTRNTRVSFLFREMLFVQDANFWTYLDELRYLRKRTPAGQLSFDNLCAIYSELLVTALSEKSWDSIRDAFDKDGLIYIPSEQAWVKSTSCVWAEAPNVGGKYGIAAVYSDLAGLFTEKFHIQAPTIATYIEQLRLLVAEKSVRSISEIKRTINCINDLRPTSESLKGLMKLPFLPVRVLGSIVKLMSPSNIFFIADRREYGKLFAGKVPFLDFSLEEIHALHRFLSALRLTDRYMSVAVQETTQVQQPSETPSNSLSQAFRAKCKAFYRCALHYRSTKVQTNGQEIYYKLRRALVYESDGFTRVLRLSYGDLTVNTLSDRGTFHLEEKNDTLNLYVPRDIKERQKCYLTQLPNELQQYLLLGDNSSSASKTFLLVIQASADVLDEILDGDGIVRIPDSDLKAFEQAEGSGDASREAEDYVDIPNEGPDSPISESIPEVHVNENPYETSTSNESQSFTSHSRSSTPYIAVDRVEYINRHVDNGVQREPRAPPLAGVSQYVQVLNKVIRLAQRTNIPSKFARTSSATAGGLSSEEHTSAFGSRSLNQLAHDIKIGAAGELFIFEILQRLSLQGFSRENWKSTIRKEVAVLQEYADLTSWDGPETSDITYKDSTSALTRILINNGYLPSHQWQDSTPRYLIEVKSTTGACDNAFFMSKKQYRLMQSHTFDPLHPSREATVYVIFRVYNLGKDNMNLRVYVDPESLRQQNALQFTAESYSVTPINNDGV